MCHISVESCFFRSQARAAILMEHTKHQANALVALFSLQHKVMERKTRSYLFQEMFVDFLPPNL